MSDLDELADNPKAAEFAIKWRKAQMHPWYFLPFVKTFDPHDPAISAKPFPLKLYCRIICEVFMRTRLLLVPKTRQMMVSWIFAAIYLWHTMRNNNQYSFVISKKEEDADENLKRAKFIYSQMVIDGLPIPKAMRNAVDGTWGVSCALTFPEIRSEIHAEPQSSNAVRSRTASYIFMDEAAFQDLLEDLFMAAKPTLSGGSPLTMVSTPNGHETFCRFVHDWEPYSEKCIHSPLIDSRSITSKLGKIDPGSPEELELINMPQSQFEKIPLDHLCAAVDGIDLWQNGGNKFNVLRVHYSADPDKNPKTETGRKWLELEEEGVPPDIWAREYEISFDTFSGRSVISNWRHSHFVGPTHYDPDAMLHIGVDFGSEVGCAIFMQKIFVDGTPQILIIDEVRLEDSNTIELAQRISAKLTSLYKESYDYGNYICNCDPAGNQRRETTSDKSLNTSIKIMETYGLKTTSRMINVKESTELVKMQFTIFHGVPGVLINPRCKHVIAAVSGGWHFPQKDSKGMPEKDGIYDHTGDCIRHGFANMLDVKEMATGKKRPRGYRPRVVKDRLTGRRRFVTNIHGRR